MVLPDLVYSGQKIVKNFFNGTQFCPVQGKFLACSFLREWRTVPLVI
jgi:hypothetical protein